VLKLRTPFETRILPWNRSFYVAFLLVFAAGLGLQSVVAQNVPQPSSISTFSGATAIQKLTQYGVTRLYGSADATGKNTVFVSLQTSAGPIYVEQVQLDFTLIQSSNIVAQNVEFNGFNSAVLCSGTLIASGTLTVGEFLPACPKSALVIDPVGNSAFVAYANPYVSTLGTVYNISFAASIASGTISGSFLATVTICAPASANIALTVSTL